jgi:AcrR family transcriptional regulator
MNTIRKNPSPKGSARSARLHVRGRLSPGDRERQIIDGSISFFSEHGLDGQLRDLAKQLGITHTLLYHYFPTKQALIERVYKELFESRWNPKWEALLDNKKMSSELKLTRFYSEYASVILNPNWVRVFVFSGLSDRYITDRYFSILREKLFPRLIRETRKFRGFISRSKPSERELELLLGLHGSIFYMGMRRWIYGQTVHNAKTQVSDEIYIHDQVLAYLISANTVLNGDRSNAKHKDATVTSTPEKLASTT